MKAWINGNPEPARHLFGDFWARHTRALCGIVVRQEDGRWTADHPRACPDCVEAIREGWDVDHARSVFSARRRARNPDTFRCAR